MAGLKIHRHLVESICNAWKEIFIDQRYADKIVDNYLKHNPKWGSRDRRFFAECVFDGVRWRRKYWWLLEQEEKSDSFSLLRFWAVGRVLAGNELPQWEEFQDFPYEQIKARLSQLEKPELRSIRESIPDWMDQWGFGELGVKWDSVLKSLNEKATVDLRVNLLKSNRETVISRLHDEGIETEVIPNVPQGLTLKERKNVFVTMAYKEGLFEVQDRGSQKVVPLLKPEPGQRIIDACAGAGGKSLHIASLMKNKGKIISLDIHEWKLKELKERARRNGVDIIETRPIDSAKIIKRLHESADGVLLDVPCTGMGVLRRNPSTKWKLTQAEVEEIKELQAQLLDDYSLMTKKGGTLVYATCSLMPSENKGQVEAFLSRHPGQWELLESLNILPDQGEGDGFFAQSLRRL